ncbi:Holliday junction branch migration protein RuvA [bacterium]|nr:Holliday junction branch migration protein RuvA [bacterium]
MIIRLKGELAHAGLDYAILDVGGVGYQVFLSARVLSRLPAIGQPFTCFTHLVHREDAMLLYGFASLEERELFLMLTSVSGVGTKTGLGILSAMDAPEVVSAIAMGDAKRLAKAPGVGKKTAERIILDLKEKLTAKRSAYRDMAPLPGGASYAPVADAFAEAELALLSLGFDPDEIAGTLSRIPAGTSVEEAIRQAIQALSGP